MLVEDKFNVNVYESFPEWVVFKDELNKLIEERGSSYDDSPFFLDLNTFVKACELYTPEQVAELNTWLQENNVPVKTRDKAGFDCFEHVWYPNESCLALPTRGTECSAGYDFMLPDTIVVTDKRPIVVKLGVRWVSTDPNKFLMLRMRSKYSGVIDMQCSGIIDADYAYNSKTYGEISLVLRAYPGADTVIVDAGEYICQGVIMNYGKIAVDVPRGKGRKGGFGSTDKKEDDGIEEAVIVEE